MKKFLTVLVSGGLLLSVGIGIADEHEGEAEEANVAVPVEMFACKFNEGKGPADMKPVYKKFNAWADKQGIDDYTAWSLAPYYASPEQDFDQIWLGVSPKAKALGRAQDSWLATGGKVQEAFDEVNTCDVHAAYSALKIKSPPERDNPSNIFISFSDCNMTDGTSFADLYNPLIEWGKYTSENGSTAGMWVFFPVHGGGGESFDFKFVAAWQNLEDRGADWDSHSEGGWQKAGELFAGKVECDSSRGYLASSVRMAEDDEE